MALTKLVNGEPVEMVPEEEAEFLAARVPAPKTPEQIQAEIVDATQKRLDDFARTRHYDNILSACTYATSTIPQFAQEGQYCVQARDMTWAVLYQIMGSVQAGLRAMPTGYADIEADLPALAWLN
jgi:hypothetical protein